jgi:hypothetical protein
MGHRTYRQRCEERRYRLVDRANFLLHKIGSDTEIQGDCETLIDAIHTHGSILVWLE